MRLCEQQNRIPSSHICRETSDSSRQWSPAVRAKTCFGTLFATPSCSVRIAGAVLLGKSAVWQQNPRRKLDEYAISLHKNAPDFAITQTIGIFVRVRKCNATECVYVNKSTKVNGTSVNKKSDFYWHASNSADPHSVGQQARESPALLRDIHTPVIDRSKISVSMERSDRVNQRLRTFRVTLSILVSGCITLGAVVWWRLLN
tara:strand:- start:60 stop:665 length:606 start_codon:yes stop_codon:yes gene_type:complete